MSTSPKIAPKIGMVSLGCPKALVDSERILTRLRAEGYGAAPDYAGSDAVVVNTCAFLDSAREESLAAIGEARASGRPVIVTGCLGAEAELIRARFPDIVHVSGAHETEAVVAAVQATAPHTISVEPFAELTAPGAVRLTPPHYAYLKISEGCDHRCSFCIIPKLRGDLASRPVAEVLAEAERLTDEGVRELLVVSQDTSAYGLDLRYAPGAWRGREWRANLEDLCRGLSVLAAERGTWVRLHYVYPYPHVDAVIPLMGEGGVLPYLDIPFQHASPSVLKAMRRPANQERTLERLARWRAVQPDLTVRSTFVVGFPGETEADFELLLDWLEQAQLDRVGVFAYENVAGAPARDLPGHVPKPVKQERRARLMAAAERISRTKLKRRVGFTIEVVVDVVRSDGALVCRSRADAPEVDGRVIVRGAVGLKPGDRASVKVERADAHDLYAAPLRPAIRRAHRIIARA